MFSCTSLIVGRWVEIRCFSNVCPVRLCSCCLCGSEPGFDGDLTDRDVPAVQLPPSSYQPYGPEAEAEDVDPYGSYGSYYQPNYPPPRPVQPDDPVIAEEEEELRSPGIQRQTRSLADLRRRQPRRAAQPT